MGVGEDRILYLSREDVRTACRQLDPLPAVREALALHAEGRTVLPAEAYLTWSVNGSGSARSLSMPGCVRGAADVVGTKIINGNRSNPEQGLPRASGLTVLFDPISARPDCILEAGYISALRTASVSALSAELLNGNRAGRLALIGAGELARAHLELLPSTLDELGGISLFDLREERALALHGEFAERLTEGGTWLGVAASAQEAIRDADLIVTVTTTTTGYIAHDWLRPGALLVHVSLDDVLPEVVLEAGKVIVDDWKLVRDDDRRLLGRMYRQGLILGPHQRAGAGNGTAKRVHAELGEILVGRESGRASSREIILVNPFGLSIEDLAVARRVCERAQSLGLGVWLER
jgi:ornithine cyclodeaminase